MKLGRDVSGARLADEPTHQRIAIPDHHPLRIGTLSAILRAVARHKAVERETIISDL